MKHPFQRISLLGGGLLGGSLALALARLPDPPAVRLWARRAETVSEALALGISGASPDMGQVVADAELAILATPVSAMPAVLDAALAAGLPATCVVSDVGSVKRQPHAELPPLLAGRGAVFIGSHPMAGSEKNGVAAADADLFTGAPCLLTNDSAAPAALTRRLEEFWRSLGCPTSWWSAAEHDALMARISHLPHILAANASLVCIGAADQAALCGNGLRDTTRVAAGEPAMWADILNANRDALCGPLREAISGLSGILAALESGDSAAVRDWLAAAQSRRLSLP